MDKKSLLLNEFIECDSYPDTDVLPSRGGDSKNHHGELAVVDSSLEIVLNHEKSAMCHYLDLPTILPLMRSRQLLTGDEFMQLLKRWETGSRETTVGLLLEMLPRKHPNWSSLLFESLQEEEEHMGHVYLVEVLRKSLERASKGSLSEWREEGSHKCLCCPECRREMTRLTQENAMLKHSSPHRPAT